MTKDSFFKFGKKNFAPNARLLAEPYTHTVRQANKAVGGNYLTRRETEGRQIEKEDF